VGWLETRIDTLIVTEVAPVADSVIVPVSGVLLAVVRLVVSMDTVIGAEIVPDAGDTFSQFPVLLAAALNARFAVPPTVTCCDDGAEDPI
jgi:hypothetical protein